MFRYLTPLKRKIGLATLTLVGVMGVSWIRSYSGFPTSVLEIAGYKSLPCGELLTFDGQLEWHAAPVWIVTKNPDGTVSEHDPRPALIVIRYWLITPLLAALSAWLLCSKTNWKPNPKAEFNAFQFFQSWRSKCGIAAVLGACVLMCGWMRSEFKDDRFEFPVGQTIAGELRTEPGRVVFRTWQRKVHSSHSSVSWDSSARNMDEFPFDRDWMYPCFRMIFTGESGRGQRPKTDWAIGYWLIVFPLVLLSVWLFLPTSRFTMNPPPSRER